MKLCGNPRSRLALALVAVLALAGCGGSDRGGPLAPADAAYLLSRLDRVDRLVAKGECKLVRRRSLAQLSDRVTNLSPDVDGAVRDTLSDGVSRLEELVATDCKQKPKPKPKPEPVPTYEPEVVPEQEPQTEQETEPQPEPEPQQEEEKKPEKPEKEEESPKPEQPSKPKEQPKNPGSGGQPTPQTDQGGGAGGGLAQPGTQEVSGRGAGRTPAG